MKLGDRGDTIEAFAERNDLRLVNWTSQNGWRHCCLFDIGVGRKGNCKHGSTRNNIECEAEIAKPTQIMDNVRCFGRAGRLRVVVCQPYATADMAYGAIEDLAFQFGLSGSVVTGETWHGHGTIYVVLQSGNDLAVYE